MSIPTLVSGDDRDVFGSRGHTENLVAVDLAVHLRQVAKGAGDAGRKVRNVTHFDQQLHMGGKEQNQTACYEQQSKPGPKLSTGLTCDYFRAVND